MKYFLVKIISRMLTVFENYLFKQPIGNIKESLINRPPPTTILKSLENNFLEDGFIRLNSKFIELSELIPMRTEPRGRGGYQLVQFYNQEDINLIANSVILNSEIQALLLRSYGMKYSVDYIFSSKNSSFPKNLSSFSIYSNTFHKDMLFSSNIIKMFVALEDITELQGPTEWIGKRESMNIKNLSHPEIKFKITEKFIGSKGDAVLLNPNTNVHRAGVPDENKTRSQLMIQLNPSKNWSTNIRLYERQFSLEENLPLLRNIGKRINCE